MSNQSEGIVFHSFFMLLIKFWNIMIEKQNLIKYNRNNGLKGRPLEFLRGIMFNHKGICMEKENA